MSGARVDPNQALFRRQNTAASGTGIPATFVRVEVAR